MKYREFQKEINDISGVGNGVGNNYFLHFLHQIHTSSTPRCFIDKKNTILYNSTTSPFIASFLFFAFLSFSSLFLLPNTLSNI